MKIIIVFTVFSFCMTTSSFAQTENKAIVQAIHDPKRVENAGKADVLQLNKNKISDTTTIVKDSVAIKKRNRSAGRKKKS